MIRLDYDNALAEADLGAAADGGIAEGDELLTAVLISLYTDAYADDGEITEGVDRGGWWGDAYAAVDGDRIGSKWWIRLARGRDLPELGAQLRDDGREALRWMIDDGIATSVDVDVTRQASGRYAVFVSVVPTSGAKRTFDIEV
jgi:phage gp46-like protein